MLYFADSIVDSKVLINILLQGKSSATTPPNVFSVSLIFFKVRAIFMYAKDDKLWKPFLILLTPNVKEL